MQKENPQLNIILRHADSIVSRKVLDETMLIPISGNLANMDNLFALNETSAFIWEAIDGKNTLEDICLLLEQHYDEQRSVLEGDLLKTIKSMLDAGLISPENIT